jgi:hypothetical protein
VTSSEYAEAQNEHVVSWVKETDSAYGPIKSAFDVGRDFGRPLITADNCTDKEISDITTALIAAHDFGYSIAQHLLDGLKSAGYGIIRLDDAT